MKKIFFSILVSFLLIACKTELNSNMEVHSYNAEILLSSEEELEKVYQQLYKQAGEWYKIEKQGENPLNLLTESQETWLQYRNKYCHLNTNFYHGGTIQPSIESSCLTQLNQSRIEELKASPWNSNF